MSACRACHHDPAVLDGLCGTCAQLEADIQQDRALFIETLTEEKTRDAWPEGWHK